MAYSFLKGLGGRRTRVESSSDSDEEVRNEFRAPSDSPPSSSALHNSANSVFSNTTPSELSSSTRTSGFTGLTAETDATADSLRSQTISKRQRLQARDEQQQSVSSLLTTTESVVEHVRQLAAKMQVLDSKTSLESAPRVSASLARLIYDYTEGFKHTQVRVPRAGLPENELCVILRIVLGFSDVYLAEDAVRGARMHLLRALYHFAISLDLLELEPSLYGECQAVPTPRCFAVGSSKVPRPNEEVLEAILDKFIAGSVPIVEQEGAYAAPVLCGLIPSFSVPTLCLGIPDMNRDHFEAIVALRSELRTLHIFARKDSIVPAGGSVVTAPFRVPTNASEPPMSISIASRYSKYISGTLGGYVYVKQENGQQLDRNVFALTCGHVCVEPGEDEEEGEKKYTPTRKIEMEYPSPVLQRLFRKALVHHSERHEVGTPQRQAFDRTLAQLNSNNSEHVLGEVVWGERTIVNGTMSDAAVVKCHPEIKCKNWMGDDIDLSQYDPTLISEQLFVRSVLPKSRGLKIFKCGSTTKYTSGVVSAIRVAYWASGVLQTSEFAVRADDSGVFANGGDSGAWIMASTRDGLGVAGMLHSYDGDFKEFGLYTPMQSVLDRLRDVTGVSWAVLGVPHSSDNLHDKGELSD